MSSRLAWWITVGLLLVASHPAMAREWTDKTGKFSVEADLVRVEGGKAILKKTNGKVIGVALDDLSAADRRYLATLKSPKDESDDPKKAIPAGQPDLQVTRVFLNEGGYLRAQVRNNGSAPATGVQVGFFVDDALQGTFNTPTLGPGLELVASSGSLGEGSHSVKVVVDPDNTIAESDESNNSMDANLSPPEPGDTPSDAQPQTDHESAPPAANVEATEIVIPRLIEPPDNATLTQPEGGPWRFDWDDVPGAILYHIQVLDSGSEAPVIDAQTAESTYIDATLSGEVLDPDLNGWTWRVRAQDKSGNWGAWSDPRTFNVAERIAAEQTSPPVDFGDEVISPLVEAPDDAASGSVLLASLVSVIAGLGSLGCFILVVIHLFQSDQKALGITCIALLFVCGIGGLIAFIKGWQDDVGTVMWVWTGCIALGVLTNFVLTVGG